MTEKPQPLESFKFGSFDLAMWNNQSQDLTTFQMVTIKRNYRDQQGNWQCEELRLLPQQLNDLALASQDMYRFWRRGMRQGKQQTSQAENQAQNSNAEQAEKTESPVGQNSPVSTGNAEQGELSGVSTGEQNFREKVTQSRGKRSR